MEKSGYVIVNCTGLDLANPGTIPGLHKELSTAIKTGKLILLEHVKNGATQFSPIPAFGGVEDGGVFASFEPVTIHVSTSDVVTI